MKKISKFKPILVVVVVLYVSITLVHQQFTMFSQKRELKKWNEELVKFKTENEKLQDDVKLSEHKDYVERMAREKLGLTKDGETTIINKK